MLNTLPRKYSENYFLELTIWLTVFFMTLGSFARAQYTAKKHQVKQDTIQKDTIKKDSIQLDTIHFSDRIWYIRNFTTETIGPGNNYWSADKTKNVWVDSKGFLHLKLTRDEQNPDKWYCAQVETQDSLGMGTYEFEVEGAIDKLNENVVLGLFSYPDDGSKSPDGFDEIDIEYSKWGEKDNPDNFNYAVWGDEHKTARKQIDFHYVSLRSIYTTQIYIRTGRKVKFESWAGFNSHKSRLYQSDVMPKTRRLKPAGRVMPVMINLWLVKPKDKTKPLPPSDGKPVEIIIHSFTFTPG
jgi:hypothetical protein